MFKVSQLAEDRGYLNVQLGKLSKSLREKEQEWLAMQQQYRELYQTHLNTQAKVSGSVLLPKFIIKYFSINAGINV